MEDKEEQLEFSKFWEALDDEVEKNSKDPKHSIVEQTPMLPKQPYPLTPAQIQNTSAVNSIKIERKTPLDYMIRKNLQMKMRQSNTLPTYQDVQENRSSERKLDPIPKPKAISYRNSPPPLASRPEKATQLQNYQQHSNCLYPRYSIENSSKPISLPPPQENNSYLRAQMLKELRNQQQRQPINLSPNRLQPPTISIPPPQIRYTTPQTEQTSYQVVPNFTPHYYESIAEPEVISEGQLLKSLQNIQDKTKLDVLLQLLDGQWHSDAELIRIAKKTRDFIGVVGFGMLMCSFEDTISKSFLVKRIDPGNTSHFKINDNYIELARSAYTQYKKIDS